MKFIKLTLKSNSQEIFVNASKIQTIHVTSGDCRVEFSETDYMIVNETPEQIIYQIESKEMDSAVGYLQEFKLTELLQEGIFSVRASNCLRAEICDNKSILPRKLFNSESTVKDLADALENKKLRRVRNMGAKSLREIKDFVENQIILK